MKKALFTALAFLCASASTALACDLKLLLSWDVSASMNDQEYDLQRRGTVKALTDVRVQNAISLMPNGVAVSIMQWAGPNEQEISVPWTMLHNGQDVTNFAQVVANVSDPFHERTGTAIGNSLKAAARHFKSGPTDCARHVIDISGDGESNIGLPHIPEADALVADGITINALVLPSNWKPGPHDVFMFYLHEVARSPSSFVVDVASYEDYWRALHRKLLRELTPYVAEAKFCAPDGWNLKRC